VGTFPASFRSASQRVHDDHQSLISELAELDAALDDLAHPMGAEQICLRLRVLSHAVPEHFATEEVEMLDIVAKVSPELKDFAEEMRRQHQTICELLLDFRLAAENLRQFNFPVQGTEGRGNHAGEVDAAVLRVKDIGKSLAQELSNHVELEENQLAGFL
jgi:hypothetical protein